MKTSPIHRVGWKRFRLKILCRDRHRCQKCGTPRQLEVHHIATRCDSPDRTFEPENCLTVCEDCHHKIHSKPTPPDQVAWRQYIQITAAKETIQ